jgi:hypothetical protein
MKNSLQGLVDPLHSGFEILQFWAVLAMLEISQMPPAIAFTDTKRRDKF